MTRLILRRGRVNGFYYPTHNRLDLPLEFTLRTVEFLSRRDMAREPLELREFLANPYVRRGRYLMTGRDLDLDAERSFYLDAIRGRTPPPLRLGLYDPKRKDYGPMAFFPRRFFATVEDRQLLEQTILRFLAETPRKWSGNPHRLAIFPEVRPCKSEF